MHKKLFHLPALDVTLATGLLAIRLVTLATGIQPGGGLISYLAAFGTTVPLAWRSVRPVTVAAVVAGSSVAEVAIGGYHDSVVGLAVWLIVAYSLGAYSRSWRQLALGVCLTATGGLWVAAQQGPVTFWNMVAVCGLQGASLLAGLWVRQLRLRAETLQRLSEELERERDERARTAVAEERARIARELHDEVAHAMSVIAVQAHAAEDALSHDPALVKSPLRAISETARSALADMRRVVGPLRGDGHAELVPGPSLTQVDALVDQARAAGLQVDLTTEGSPAALPGPVDLAAYRVVQEGLTNVRKHAAATRAGVVIRYEPAAIRVEVTDDGDGGGAGGGSGRGLLGIRERVALLGGEFAAGPNGSGYALRVTLPTG